MIAAEKASDPTFNIAAACRAVGVSESGFYAWQRRQHTEPTPRATRSARLRKLVVDAFEWSQRRYGIRRVHAHLGRQGIRISIRTVAHIFRELGLKTVHPEPWRYHTQRDTDWQSKDLVQRDFTATEPCHRFVGDITQIDTAGEPAYLATVIDLFNREVVGWAVADHHRAELVIDAINMAKRNGLVKRRAVFHSDRGSEYTSRKFRAALRRNGIRQSMGRVGTCYDNAAAESFFATIKKECLRVTVPSNVVNTRQIVGHFIEVWYNRLRLHSTLDYRTPYEVRLQFEQAAA